MINPGNAGHKARKSLAFLRFRLSENTHFMTYEPMEDRWTDFKCRGKVVRVSIQLAVVPLPDIEEATI